MQLQLACRLLKTCGLATDLTRRSICALIGMPAVLSDSRPLMIAIRLTLVLRSRWARPSLINFVFFIISLEVLASACRLPSCLVMVGLGAAVADAGDVASAALC